MVSRRPVKAQTMLSKIQHNMDCDDMPFQEFIQELRHSVAMEYGYIMSNSSYDDMVLDLVQLGELSPDILPLVKFEKDDK
ncbi:hypothetical protein [Staphylococcus phage PT94]